MIWKYIDIYKIVWCNKDIIYTDWHLLLLYMTDIYGFFDAQHMFTPKESWTLLWPWETEIFQIKVFLDILK